MANDFFSALTEGGQTISGPEPPSNFEGIASDLIMRGLNHFFGDPVQEVNLARQQVESANRALTEGLTLKEAGVDTKAIDAVLPGYSATLLGAENLPSFRQRRAFAQQVFAPEAGSVLAPHDPQALQQQVLSGELHNRKPFAGIGQEPSDATVRQRTESLSPAIQQAQFGIPAQEDVRAQLLKEQIKAEDRQSRRGQIASVAASLSHAVPGVDASYLRRAARHVVLGKPLWDTDLDAKTQVGGGGGGAPSFSDITSAVNSYTQFYQGTYRPALTDQKWLDLKPRDRQQYSPEMQADRNLKRVPEVVQAVIQNFDRLSQLAAIRGGQGPSEDLMTTIEREAVFLDESGNLVPLASMKGLRAEAIRKAIRAQVQQFGEQPGPSIKGDLLAEGKGEVVNATQSLPAVASAAKANKPRKGAYGAQPVPSASPPPQRTPTKYVPEPTFVPSQRPGVGGRY